MSTRHRTHRRRRSRGSTVGTTILGFIAVAVLLAAIATGAMKFVNWRLDAIANEPPSESMGLVVDVSPSMNVRCNVVERMVEEGLKARHIGKDSRVIVVSNGDQHSSWFPELKLNAPVSGQAAGPYGNGRQDLTDQVKATCAQFTSTESSPIFAAVKIALEQLRSHRCGPAVPCSLHVLTDLLETADAEVIRRIGPHPPANPKPVVDNTGIDVVFCGWAVSKNGSAYGLDATPLKTGWASLFTVAPTFQPYCEGTAPAAAH